MNETADPSNVTTSTKSESHYLQNITIFLYIVICILGVIGNGLVIYVTGFRVKKTVDTVMFLNLAMADFLFTFFLIFSIVYLSRNYDWPFGDFMCKFSSFVTAINMFASIFLLTAISLDRCLSTWVVEWVQNKRTLTKARVTCFIIWFASICCSLPYCIYRRTQLYGQSTVCYHDFPESSKLSTFKFLTVFRFMVGFLVPFIIITGSYVAIGVRIRRLKHKTMKPLKTILAVILAFFFCWLPFHIYLFVDLWAQETRATRKDINLDSFKVILDITGSFLATLAFLNSCLNPFLYVFMCKEYKTKLKQSLLLVLESAFAEEHLSLLVSQYSLSHRKSHSQSVHDTEDTVLSA
ncbi:chemerin-like receptor 1 [Salminus brasiliensis]|uniref:chemerin-like receptor 1 n=1 Tax=Salminus brasiliensis TaxID=930266 RepID=UPI003B82FE93